MIKENFKVIDKTNYIKDTTTGREYKAFTYSDALSLCEILNEQYNEIELIQSLWRLVVKDKLEYQNNIEDIIKEQLSELNEKNSKIVMDKICKALENYKKILKEKGA